MWTDLALASRSEIRIICTTSSPFLLMVRPPKLGRILAAEATLQPVLAKAHELRALAGLLDGYLPPELARQTRVINYRDGELVLVAATPAAAAKLRLLAPSLANFFLKQRLQVNSVSTRVQPNASREPDAAPQKSAYLSTLTLDRLSRLYKTMRNSPAREALRVLLQRRGRSPGASEGAPLPQTESGSRSARKPRT
jgi:hypothetical protein